MRAAAGDVATLERVAARGWPAEHTRWLGHWLLRANDGFTGRANSVLVLGEPDRPVDDALAAVRDWYAGHGLPTRFSLPSPVADALGHELRHRGFVEAVRVHVMVADVASLSGATTGPRVAVRPRPSAGWRTRYRERGAVPAAAWRLLERPTPVGFAEVEGDDGSIVAIARGTVTDGWLGVTAVRVTPSHRRLGLAGRLLAALVDWGRTHEAAAVYLQVSADNDAALAMYRRAGFTVHHDYRYLEAPAADTDQD